MKERIAVVCSQLKSNQASAFRKAADLRNILSGRLLLITCQSPDQAQGMKNGNKMTSSSTVMLISVLFFVLVTPISDGAYLEQQWCVADEQTPDDVLQLAMDWACGVGDADCKMIQPNKPCYLPNTVRDHASYAFNSYWQKFKNYGGSCYFNAAAMVTDLNPSHGLCHFESLP